MANPQRSTTVVTEALGDGLGVFDPNRKQFYALNAPSALVFQHADGQTTPQQLAELLRRTFNVALTQAEQLLWLTLDELQKANLLQGAFTTTQAPQPLLSRRQALRSFAAVGLSLALLPLVAPVVYADTGRCKDDGRGGDQDKNKHCQTTTTPAPTTIPPTTIS